MKKNQIFALLFTGVLSVLLFIASCDNASKKSDGHNDKQPAEQQKEATKDTTAAKEASVEKALELIEKGTNPMEGIMMLRQVAENNPGNAQAQFYLGIFSLQTGQFEKAKERFEKVLSIDPNSLEAHLYYSDALAQLGDTEKAIEELNKALELTDNEELKGQINKRITELKKM